MPEYPGLGLPLRYDWQERGEWPGPPVYPIGACGESWGAHSDIVQVRELAMMDVMEKLTNKVDWHKKVFEDSIVSKWREEALAIPNEVLWKLAIAAKSQHWDQNGNPELNDDINSTLVEQIEGIMTENTFDCCIQELRSKAKYYEKTGIVPVMDACASVAKSDKLVSPELHEDLREAFEKLRAEQASAPDWHPNSQEMVQDLIHPSLYPLVYGRTRALKEEVVGLTDAIKEWAGKGEVIPIQPHVPNSNERISYNVGSGKTPPDFWSDNYQWLPANVAFQEDGAVKFTSYINNLHPQKHSEIYHTIEKLIATALPAWDQCLTLTIGYNQRRGAGRITPRIPVPDSPDDESPENWSPTEEECEDKEVDMETINAYCKKHEGMDFDEDNHLLSEIKWNILRKPRVPEPEFKDISYSVKPGKRLSDRFKESGLQIIVKVASIELTPDKPEFPAGGWHVEGQMNEQICATALYYLDSENVTTSNLSFRMQTSAYLNDDIDIGQDAYHYMERIYGTSLGSGNAPCLQNYGSVETRQGRLLAFPNVFQHRVSSFRLEDPTKPGHRRFIALWLVDPNKRIISTANVPPQQQNWWLDSVFGTTPESRKAAMSKLPPEVAALISEKLLNVSAPLGSTPDDGTLPPELMELVREHFNATGDTLPMTLEEAKEHRLKLMRERSAHAHVAERDWQEHSYSFCEH